MKQGRVYMRQAGTSEEWRDVGNAEGFSVALEVNEPVPILTGGFTFSTRAVDPEVLKLYYGMDVKSAGINNRGGARKEEKHMGVRKFESSHEDTHLHIEGDRVGRTTAGSGVYMKLRGDGFGWFNKADVPLIAHALFEKSGWPDAWKGDGDAYKVTVGGESGISWVVGSEREANKALAEAIANLAAVNAWVEGEADRKAKAEEVAKAAEEEARRKRERDELRTSPIALEALKIYNKLCSTRHASWDATNGGLGCNDEKVREYIRDAEAARDAKKREHDALRTSPIALEALAIYNKELEGCSVGPYASWDAVNSGTGARDAEVREYIRDAEAARDAKPAPKVGDRVRVSADSKTASGDKVYFGKSVEGTVVRDPYGWALKGDIRVSTDDPQAKEREQYVDPKYVTVVATAEDLAAEKAKAERDAGIAALIEVDNWLSPARAGRMYDRGIRATA